MVGNGISFAFWVILHLSMANEDVDIDINLLLQGTPEVLHWLERGDGWRVLLPGG